MTVSDGRATLCERRRAGKYSQITRLYARLGNRAKVNGRKLGSRGVVVLCPVGRDTNKEDAERFVSPSAGHRIILRRDQSLLRGSSEIPDPEPKTPTCQAELKTTANRSHAQVCVKQYAEPLLGTPNDFLLCILTLREYPTSASYIIPLFLASGRIGCFWQVEENFWRPLPAISPHAAQFHTISAPAPSDN